MPIFGDMDESVMLSVSYSVYGNGLNSSNTRTITPASCLFPVSERMADKIIRDFEVYLIENSYAIDELETALESFERLRENKYIRGSVKTIDIFQMEDISIEREED